MIDENAFKDAMRLFASGITVLTWQNPEQDSVQGITVSAFASLSLNPPLVLFCIDKGAYIYPQLKNQEFLTINILSSTQMPIAHQFAGGNREGLENEISYENSKNQPKLVNAQAALLVRIRERISQGDHDIFVAEVHESDLKPELYPLLYHNSRLFA